MKVLPNIVKISLIVLLGVAQIFLILFGAYQLDSAIDQIEVEHAIATNVCDIEPELKVCKTIKERN